MTFDVQDVGREKVDVVDPFIKAFRGYEALQEYVINIRNMKTHQNPNKYVKAVRSICGLLFSM